MKNKKYPIIEPQYINNKEGKPVKVYLPYHVYESIFVEIKDLEKHLKVLKSRSKLKKI